MPKQKKTQSRPKPLYRVKNWSDYDKALVQRGSLTFWLTDDFEVKEIFHLTNRQTEGLMRSLFALMKVNFPVPDHSTLSKRGKN